jgi:hypothetical protein
MRISCEKDGAETNQTHFFLLEFPLLKIAKILGAAGWSE